MDMVTTIGGTVLGFEFKHNDVPSVTNSMRIAADDLGAKRVFVLYPGPDTFALDKSERFVALAWRVFAGFRSDFLSSPFRESFVERSASTAWQSCMNCNRGCLVFGKRLTIFPCHAVAMRYHRLHESLSGRAGGHRRASAGAPG